MTILFRLIMLSMFSFAYSDCVDIDNQTDCEASAGCEWHVEDDGTAGCEDADDHDHDHEHCDDVTTESECENLDGCTWHIHDGEGECEDAQALCDDVTTETECENIDGCTWHIHDGEGECESASADCGETDHFNTDGLELEYDGAEIYSQFQGLIEGNVEIEVNGTKDLSIHFLDGNGDEVVIDESNIHCYPLSFSIANPSIISIEMEDHDDHDDHDHDDEEHCEDFMTADTCSEHDECEWHVEDDGTAGCEDAEGDDHDDHDHDDEEHCEDFLTETDCGAHTECEWHVEDDGTAGCEDAEGDDHDDHDHDDEEHGGHLTFELSGLSIGSTTFTVSIMHQGHADYTSMPIL